MKWIRILTWNYFAEVIQDTSRYINKCRDPNQSDDYGDWITNTHLNFSTCREVAFGRHKYKLVPASRNPIYARNLLNNHIGCANAGLARDTGQRLLD